MTTILPLRSIPHWARPSKGLLGAISLGLATFAVTWAMLPPHRFQAHALVSIADVGSPSAEALTKAAAEASVSEAVIRRAATSRLGTKRKASEPAVLHRLGRDVLDLGRTVSAQPGETPGSLEITARDPNSVRAAQVALAVANALIADRDELAATIRQKRDRDQAADMQKLNLALESARERLAALGSGVDPSDIRSAARRTARAKARAEAIHAVMTSGAPALSESPAPSATIQTLQSAYLTVSQKLQTALETLGERHVTVIALRTGVQQAAASLTAEWKRLARLADADLAVARRHEAALRTSDAAMDTAHRAMIDAARRDVRIAETMISRAQAAPVDSSHDVRPYWLMSSPAVSTSTNGLSAGLRAFMAAIMGLLAAEIVLAWPALRNIRMPSRGIRWMRPDWLFAQTDDPGAIRGEVSDATASDWADVRVRALADADPEGATTPRRQDKLVSHDVLRAAGAGDSIPTIMVATNESPANTRLVSLAIGRAAVDAGLRVLIVETPRPRPTLAVAVDDDASPVIVDLFGDLRVALRASGTADLYLAPSFADGARLASTLARDDEVPLLGGVETAFDLVVIDGGQATEDLAAAWPAGSYVRVGTSRSQDDDSRFAATFGIPVSTLLETIVTPTSASDVAAKPSHSRASKVSLDARWASAPRSGVFVKGSHIPFARPAAAGRISGARSSLSKR